MVGGLVEDQQLARVHQGAGQCHPLGLTAREVRDTAVEQTAHPQPVKDRLRLPAPADRLADVALRKLSILVQHTDPDPAAAADQAGLRALDPGQDP